MRFGLEESTIEKIQQVFERYSKVDKVLVFGSRAKGNYRPDSDIDLAVKGVDIALNDILSMSTALEENGIIYKIDLVSYADIKEKDLIEHIDRVGVEFYSRWQEYRFSDFVEINPTVSLKGNDEYSFVEMRDLQDGKKYCSPTAKRKTSSGARFHEKDTLFARITPCLENGKICQVRNLEKGIGFGSTEFLVFRGRTNVSDNNFVFYLSRWDEVRGFAESNFEGTSGRQRVPKNCFKNLKLELPPLTEQIAIASILSSLDDKIELLHRQNKTLEQLAETLFRQWFKVEAEESWEVGQLGDLVDFVYGKTLKDSERSGGNYPVVGSSGIVGYHNKYLVEAPGIVTGRKGTLGRVNYMFENFTPIDTTFYITSKINSKGLYYEYFLLKSLNLLEFNTDSAVPGLNKNIALTAEVTIPDSTKISLFNETVEPTFLKININQVQINTLIKTRDILLPKLMSGEVRVEI